MPDDPKQPEEVKPSPAIDLILKAVKLDWIRPLLYKIGGRKVAVGGGALALMSQVIGSDMADWPKAITCVAVAVLAVGTSLAIGIEDNSKKEGTK